MTTADNYMGLGPEGDIQELPPNSRTYSFGYDSDGYMEAVAASGKARRQYKYKKGTHRISYDYAKRELVDRIIYLYESEVPLKLKIKDGETLIEKEVWMNPINPQRFIVVGDGLFRNVNLQFREV